jgi:hypothetical protein|tara:strand:+ start:489 stop:947 length:459 start_codon:yes stop_codon:yes gene_type:complete
MATTVNNTTINTKLIIIFDADKNQANPNDGPAKGTGNTESDVYIDDVVHTNLRSHTEIDSNIHALQWDAVSNNGHIEYIDNRDNLSIDSIPQWAANVVIRVEAENEYHSAWSNTFDNHSDKDAEDNSTATNAANTAAETARTNYLSGHSITY